jgi:Bacterial Ig domain
MASFSLLGGGSVNFTENGAATQLDGDASVSGVSSYDGATLTLNRSTGSNGDDLFISELFDEGQVMVVVDVRISVGNYSASDGALVITFNENATDDRVATVIQSLKYANGSDNPPNSVTIDYTFDNGGLATGHVDVTIIPTNDPPVIGGALPAVYEPGSSGTVLSTGIQITDPDNTSLTGATVTLNKSNVNDLLTASTGGTGVTPSFTYDNTKGEITLTLTGTAPIETYRQVLASVTYSSSDGNPAATGERVVSWSVSDGSVSGSTNSSLDFAPAVDLDQNEPGTGFSTSFSQGGSAVGVVDTDDQVLAGTFGLASANVVITNVKPGDTLTETSANAHITVEQNAPGQLTLVSDGAATAADFEAALRGIVFNNSSNVVSPVTRDITVAVSDGVGNSATAHTLITVNSVDHAGGAADDTANSIQNTILSVGAPGVLANDNDPDGLTVITGTVQTSQHGTIQFNGDGSYSYTPPANFVGSDSVGYTAQDPFGSQVSATLHITITAGATNGTAGNDSFNVPNGNSAFNGFDGIDTVTFGFKLVDATVSYVGNQVIIDSASSHTVLTGFETFTFTDGTVNNADGDRLVDDLFYYSSYHDVWNAHADADVHFHSFGWHEGRDPDAFFDTSIYLNANPDVKASGVDPLIQFDQSGWKQVRFPSLTFDTRHYLDANPDVKAAGVDPLTHFLAFGAQEGRQPFKPVEFLAANGFDYVYYLNHNPDVAAAGVDAFQHFETVGWKEGRNPNALFDTNGYLTAYADVKAAGVNPLDHYDQFGWKEGRDPSTAFDTTDYLTHYADVNAAHVNPLNHFLHFGIYEGRIASNDGHFG